VPKCRIFDPETNAATLLELCEGVYDEWAALGVSDTLTTPLLPRLEIPLADVFRNPRRPSR
jgi:hypothetical protein